MNRGGFANPDVLRVVREDGRSFVVKDYAHRSRWVRALLAPALVRHELAMLERARGLPGVPASAGRVDALALAMEWIDGVPLRRRSHAGGIPAAFFSALEGILEGLAARGLLYTDLRSPSNILVTHTGAPALVDLASAFRFPVPRSLTLAIERRALVKLRRRFAGGAVAVDDPVEDVDLGTERLGVVDSGPLRDPVPALLLPDSGLPATVFGPLLAQSRSAGRRVLAIDLPGFGRARRSRRAPTLERSAALLLRFLDVARLGRVDVIGHGWGGLVGAAVAREQPARVRRVIATGAPASEDDPQWTARLAAAARSAEALRELLEADLAADLPTSEREALKSALAQVQERVRAAHLALPPLPELVELVSQAERPVDLGTVFER